MLLRLNTPEADGAWDDLFGAVLHQGTASSSAHAVVPYILELAEKTDIRVASEKHLFFIGMVARSLTPAESPPDVFDEYLAALERTLPLAAASLHAASTVVEAVYAIQLLASLDGRTALAHVIERLADQGAEFSCPACRGWILVEQEPQGWRAFPGPGAAERSTILAPRPIPASPRNPSADLSWAAALAQDIGPRDDLLEGLAVLNAHCTCPLCAHTFSIYDDALALLEQLD